MEINIVGLASAAATFFGVWLGHVSVRKIEREVVQLWIPSACAIALGIGLELASLWSSSRVLSAMCAIVGVTLLWDALEIHRQQNRVRHGHAPANPRNPRHIRILAECPQATTIDWLDRDPRGLPFTETDLQAIKDGSK